VAQPVYPDLQVVQFSVSLYPDIPRDINAMFGLNVTLMNQWWANYFGQDARTLVLWLGRPKSVGTLKLNSTDPHDIPLIDPKYLDHPDDIEALLYGKSL
jgi:choline dehydrogenase-like flavoprotein